MQALKATSGADAPDIYALSLFVYDEDDKPQQPALIVGYNTESRRISISDILDVPGKRRMAR